MGHDGRVQPPDGQTHDERAAMGMGPQPAIPGCQCRICRPDAKYDESETRCIGDVLRHGWHVLLVGAGQAPDEPGFGYTVGLMHRVGHPELLISGLSNELMHSVLNDVAERVLNGRRFVAGDAVEGSLSRVPLLVDELDEAGLKETVTWSRWFHRRPVPALQLVWPDTAAIFAWQPGAATVLNELQPPSWRKSQPRVGAFARTPVWPLPAPAEALGFICTHVSDDGDVIRFVVREMSEDRGEEWSFHCGAAHDDPGNEVTVVHLSHVVRAAPSLWELADLGVGEEATRADADHPWQRSASLGP